MTPTLRDRNYPEPGRFYSAYSKTRRDVTVTCEYPSPYTDQSQKNDCDINHIMARYQSVGVLPVLNQAPAQWLDVSDVSYQQHMDAIIEAKTMFQSLPSSVREKFANDPGRFLSFCEDSSNLPELARMGLLTVDATQRILNQDIINRTQNQENEENDA